MILFYDKRDGKVFATIDGRVHNPKTLKNFIDDGRGKKNIGKYIIGWEETGETEEKEVIQEELVEVGKNLFTKIKNKVKIEVPVKIEHNKKDFKLLQKFEDNSSENPLKYKIVNNNLIKI